MEDFGPVPESLLDFSPPPNTPSHFLVRHEGQRWVRKTLRDLNQRSRWHDRPFTWGFTIFRTVYTPESDETFPRAVEELNQLARQYVFDDLRSRREPGQEPFDPRPNEELARRFYCDIIQDAASLDGASPDEVGRRFDAWVAEHHLQPPQPVIKMGRFCVCIMLDQQGIDHFLQVNRAKRSFDRAQYDLYVKVVTEFSHENEEGEDRLWMRVGIRGQLWSFAWDWPDMDITEMGVEGETERIRNWYGWRC